MVLDLANKIRDAMIASLQTYYLAFLRVIAPRNKSKNFEFEIYFTSKFASFQIL